MPFAENSGAKIHFETWGEGEPLVVQHGFMSSIEDLASPPFVEAVGEHFKMIFIESLGHGQSDGPDDPARYTLANRAGDVACVLDALGVEKAHFFGYSMGGWIGTGVAKHRAERLLSLCIAGWPVEPHIENALSEAEEEDKWAKTKRAFFFSNPKGFARITPDTEPGLKNCWKAMSETAGAMEALKTLDVPVLIACGMDDGIFDETRSAAEAIDKPFMPVPGNHDEAIDDYLGGWFPRVCDFFFDASEGAQ